MRTYFPWMGHLSRRRFCRSSVAVASTLVVGSLSLPAQANAARGVENIQVSHDSFAVHAETYLAANPRQSCNLVGICIAEGAKGNTSLATYASFDGGAHWQSNSALPAPAGSIGMTDPTVAFDGAGQCFACGTVMNGTLPTDRAICVWRSIDGGRSFAASVPAMQGLTVDHPWLAADRSREPASSNLYVVWAAENLTRVGLARSTDGGLSFGPPRMITDAEDIVVAGAMAAVGTRGLVAAIYAAESSAGGGNEEPDAADNGGSGSGGGRRPETIGAVRVVCSTDYGRTFGAPVELGTTALELVFPDGMAGSASLPALAVDPRRNRLYAVFVTHQSQASSSDILLAISSDCGRTWDTARPVTPTNNTSTIYFQPQLAVDKTGRIAISAYAFDSEQRLVSLVLFLSEPSSLRFGPPLLVSSQPFNPAQGAPGGGNKHGTWWIGDFQGLVSTPGAFHPFWDDTRTGELEVFTATVRAPW